MKKYHANGKLLITGEYLVLKGAKALAIPLNKGQTLSVETSNEAGLQWRAETLNGLWFEAKFNSQLNLIETTDHRKATTLQQFLHRSVQQNSTIQAQLNYTSVTTMLEFDPNWGWGSSSTLLHLLKQWLGIDPYQLMDETIGGSGYDIACAASNGPIIYRRTAGTAPQIMPAHFNPPFIHKIGIVYLNKKQNSSAQVKSFLASTSSQKDLVKEISELSEKIATTKEINAFISLVKRHEAIIAKATGLTPVQELLFPDFNGAIKSLGAWGGDFALFLSQESFQANRQWFQSKGYPVVMPLKEVVINRLNV